MANSSISTPYGRGRSRCSTHTHRSFWVCESEIIPCGGIVEYCDGWIPRPIAGFTPKGAVNRLRRTAEQKERDPKSLSISVFRLSR